MHLRSRAAHGRADEGAHAGAPPRGAEDDEHRTARGAGARRAARAPNARGRHGALRPALARARRVERAAAALDELGRLRDDAPLGDYYGAGWWVDAYPCGGMHCFVADGWKGRWVIVVPSERAVVVFQSVLPFDRQEALVSTMVHDYVRLALHPRRRPRATPERRRARPRGGEHLRVTARDERRGRPAASLIASARRARARAAATLAGRRMESEP